MIQLSEHFNLKKLLRFTLPSIAMMIITSVYGVVDGIFVSNFVGESTFVSVNLIMPMIMVLGAFGYMIGTGGSALVAKTLGEGNREKANKQFSMLIYVTIALGLIITAVGMIFLRPISYALGANETLIENCVAYGSVLFIAFPTFLLQSALQSFLVVAERPKTGMIISVAAGLTNILLDYLFICVFGWGVVGAAVATAIGQIVGGVIPFVFFLRRSDNVPLRLVFAGIMWRDLWKTCTNGSSEMMTNVSMSLVNILFNAQLMALYGERGVAAYGVIMYISFIFISAYIGYSVGTAPIVAYHYGAKNTAEFNNVLKKSLMLIGIAALFLTAAAEALALPLALLFVGGNGSLTELTTFAIRIFSLSFVFAGFNIFGSAFFTALGNGLISAALSFVRSLVFQISMIYLLPVMFGANAIWASVVIAEFLALILTVILLILRRKKYGYWSRLPRVEISKVNP